MQGFAIGPQITDNRESMQPVTHCQALHRSRASRAIVPIDTTCENIQASSRLQVANGADVKTAFEVTFRDSITAER